VRSADLEEGMEVAARDDFKRLEKAIVREVNLKKGHLVEFETGRIRGTARRVSSHAIKCVWDEYLPEYTKRRRAALRDEVVKAQEQYDKNEKMEHLEVIREALKMFGINAGIGNVYVPSTGYDPTIFVRYEHALELHRILTEYASLKLTTNPTNDS
jgi:hypothetical protein